MNKERIQHLLHNYAENAISIEERKELYNFLKDTANAELFADALYKVNDLSADERSDFEEWHLSILDKIYHLDKPMVSSDAIPGRSSQPPTHRIHFLKTAWFRYAAAIILLFGAVAYFWTTDKKAEQTLANGSKSLQADIAPGTNKAVLTLADGSTIILDSAANGMLAQQGNAHIIKLSNGQIAYNLKGIAKGEVMINTMNTPRGGQYQLVLPDGSKVWLNAASSIAYPAVFVGKERKVKIIGEAYLEVAKNKAKPFIVDVDGKSSIEVLGTSFNINSYADESTIKTTLIEGSVKVKVGENESLLQPGQRAEVVQNSNTVKVIDNVDIAQTLAWKNGFFNLQDLSLQEVVRQLERWYDIKVKYEGTISETNFKGELSRGVKLSTVLRWFSELGIQNKLEGRTLILSAD